MGNNNNAVGDTDILDELLELLEGNGGIDTKTRDRILVKSLIEVVRRTRKIERESVVGYFRRNPVKIILLVAGSFVLLHEFATYIPLGLLVVAFLKALGVPL